MVLTISLPSTASAQVRGGTGGGTPSAEVAMQNNANVNSADCWSWSSGVNFKACAAGTANIILSFFAFLLGLSAGIMTLAINYTIIGLRDNLDKITAINDTWAALRDLINLSFIFILLFAAIRTILGLESPGKIIKNIVLAALFINFSMFFTRAMVDASNSVALFFYDRLVDSSSVTTGDSSLWGLNSDRGTALVNAYVGPLKLTTLYNSKDTSQVSVGNTDASAVSYGTIITVGILGSLMLGLVAFVFLAIAFMFIIRYAALVLILIFSPFGFISSELPMIGEYNKQWWETLKSQLLFPPIFMILTWISLKVIANLGFETNSGGLREALTAAAGQAPKEDSIALVINFLVIMVLIIMSLLISIETASKGSQALSGFYKKSTKWAGTAMFGGASLVGEFGLGTPAQMLKKTNLYKKLEARAPESFASRLALGAIDTARTTSFDARNTGFVKQFGATTGLDAGTGRKTGGAEAGFKASAEFLELKGTDSAKKRAEKARLAQTQLDILAGEHVSFDNSDRDELNTLETTVGPLTLDQTKRRDELRANKKLTDSLEMAITRSTDKEIETMVAENRKLLDSPVFAQKISAQQLEAINKSDKFTEQEKDTLKGHRFANTNSLTTSAPSIKARKETQSLTDKELEMIAPEILTDPRFIEQLKQSQVDAIMKSSKFTSSQKAAIGEARKEQLKNLLDNSHQDYNPEAARKLIGEMEPKAIAGLNIDILTNDEILPILGIDKLKRMAVEMSSENIAKMRGAINDLAQASTQRTLVGGPRTPEEIRQAARDNRIQRINDWATNGNGRFDLI